MTQFTKTGEEDKQSECALLNIEYLKRNNLLDEHGKFTYNPAKDTFIHKGIEYEAGGDSLSSQAYDNPLFFMLILKRKNAPST